MHLNDKLISTCLKPPTMNWSIEGVTLFYMASVLVVKRLATFNQRRKMKQVRDKAIEIPKIKSVI